MSESWQKIDTVVQEVVQVQKDRLLRLGRLIIPNLTSEDILQPNDYPMLENSPAFRYEEGVLAGMQAMQMALNALKKE